MGIFCFKLVIFLFNFMFVDIVLLGELINNKMFLILGVFKILFIFLLKSFVLKIVLFK